MKTLQYLAGRLGKSVSYFLEETAVLSPNQELMITVRQLYDSGNFREAAKSLEQYHGPDPVYDREKELLWVLLRLELAKEAIGQERFMYAAELLNQTPVETAYLSEELQRRKLLLLGKIPGQNPVSRLPSMDDELLLRAEHALNEGNLIRATHLLEAMDQQNTPQWHLLRGRVFLKQNRWKPASEHLHTAEAAFPGEVIPLLETCYRESGNFRKAYEYACKQRK